MTIIKIINFFRWIGLIFIGLLIYGQTFHFDFVFDDHIFIVNNPYIKDFHQIPQMWHFFPMTRLVGMYSFAFNYYLNQLHPEGYHVFNLIVHFLGVGLVWALAVLLFKITKNQGKRQYEELPYLIALLFLVHPCQTQAVSYITQRFESMATVFYLGSIYCYLRARLSTDKINSIIFFLMAAMSSILGVMTKEVGITVPAMMLASEWILLGRKDSQKYYMIIFLGSIFLYLLFIKMLRADGNVLFLTLPSESHDGDILTPWHYFLTQMRVFLTFLRILILPIHQNLDYDYPASVGLLQPPLTLAGMSVICCFIFLIVKLRRNFPLIAFGLSWMLITFSVNLAPRENVIFEHKLYLISFGFFLSFVVVLSQIIHNHRLLFKVLICFIVVFGLVSFQRNKVWANELTLLENCIQESPQKARVNANLGTAYALLGRYKEAIYYLDHAIERNPNNAKAYYNRGFTFAQEGNTTQAIADLTKAIGINPLYTEAYNNLGIFYVRQGNYNQAISEFTKAIKIKPDDAEAYYNLGKAYAKQNSGLQTGR